jgi:oligopeptide transport system substrate-binding protein
LCVGVVYHYFGLTKILRYLDSGMPRFWVPVSGVLVTLTVLVFLAGCSQPGTPPGDAGAGMTLRRGLGGEPASLDPAFATDGYSSQVLQDLYEGLTSESPSGGVIPAIASTWEVDESGKQYTFRIRSDAHWSNGKPIRAQDFVVAWRRVLEPSRASPVANELRLIAGATAIIAGRALPSSLGATATSDNALVVILERPAPYFPQLLSHSATFPIYSDSAAGTHDPKDWVSDGPFVLSSWQPGATINLIRNKEYWDSARVLIRGVQYLFSPDQNMQFAAYRAGQLDMTDTVPANALGDLRKEHASEIVIAPYLATAYYALNLVSSPLSGNLNLRKALALAVDRQRLVEGLGLGQVAAYGFVPPGTWNYTLQQWEWHKSTDADRIAEAKRLYRRAGYSEDAPLHLRVLLNSNPAIKQTAILIAAMWKKELGIETELINEEFRVFLQSRADKKKWDVVRLAWNADYNDAGSFLDVLRKNSPNNTSGYGSLSFDNLLDYAAVAPNLDIRRNQLETAERVMLSDYPVIPLYFLVSKRLVKPYVVGVQPNPLDRIGSKTLSLLPH